MADAQKNLAEEWRLGIEPGEHPPVPPARLPERAPSDLSHQRLDRPLYVFTAGHLGWLAIVLYALATRLIAVRAAPLTRAAAQSALRELSFLSHGPGAFNTPTPLHSTWVHMAAGALMGALGAGDFSARLIFALAGLLLIGAALAMRSSMGRAGSLALAALLALSPSALYFSRAGAAAVPVMAMAVLAIAIFMGMRGAIRIERTAALGAVVGLMLSAGPSALPTAASMLLALLVTGLWYAAASPHPFIRARVWWRRRALHVAVGICFAIGVWLCFTTNLFTRPIVEALESEVMASWQGAAGAGYVEGLRLYLPILGFYEFLILILGVLGAILLLARRIRSAFAGWSLAWACLSAAFYLWAPARSPARVLEIAVPLAFLGGFAIDYLHHTEIWRALRYPLGILALLTVYICALTSFVYAAPDASEAPWARHALLMWSAPVTTIQTVSKCAQAEQAARKAARATVAFSCDDPVLRWYLRGLKPTAAADRAGVWACAATPGSEYQQYSFDRAAAWRPDLRTLTVNRAIRYYFTARAWSPLTSSPAVLYVNGTPTVAAPNGAAHTMILSPPAGPPSALSAPDSSTGAPAPAPTAAAAHQ